MNGVLLGLALAPIAIYFLRKHLDSPVVLAVALTVAVCGILIAIIISLLNHLFPV